MKKRIHAISAFLLLVFLASLFLASCGSGETATTTPEETKSTAPGMEYSEPMAARMKTATFGLGGTVRMAPVMFFTNVLMVQRQSSMFPKALTRWALSFARIARTPAEAHGERRPRILSRIVLL